MSADSVRTLAVRQVVGRSIAVGVLIACSLATPAADATTPGSNGVIAATKGGDLVFINSVDGSLSFPFRSVLFVQDPAWSPDGSWLAYGLGGNLAVARADGSDLRKLGFAGTAGSWDMSISWAPDGASLIYVDRARRLYSVTKAGTNEVTLASNVNGAAYSPDGQHIVISRGDLEVIDPDGQNPTPLLALPDAQRAPDWSPDGSQIAFQSRGPDGWDVWVVNADGTSPTLLTQNPANDTDPTWAPDGSAILFRSERGDGGLFTVAPVGGGATRVSPSTAVGEPSWQPQVVGLSASRRVVDPGRGVTLRLHLAFPLENPSLIVERRAVGGVWKRLVDVDVTGKGRAAVDVPHLKASTDFRARWTGDTTHPRTTSLVVRVDVRSIARGRLQRASGSEGIYKIYRDGQRAWYLARVIPNHAGKRACLRLQRRKGGWHEIAFRCFRLRTDSTVLVSINPLPVGTRLRIHTEFRDKDHLPATSAWSYFRFVA